MSSSESTSAAGSPLMISRASSQTSLEIFDDETDAPVRNIVFVGAGYVGGPTAAVIASQCPNIRVTVVDKSRNRIQQWRSKHLPIHEPGLSDIVRLARDGSASRAPNLFFSTDCDEHIAAADIIYLAVNTPTKTNGIGAGAATDISMFESAARSVALAAQPGAIIVEKSTVPCRTADMVREILNFHRPGVPFEVLSNPEFLAEGTAIQDLINPSRVLIGSSTTTSGRAAAARLADVYAGWVPRENILTIDVWSSELAKLVANAMLAQRISSINSISAICEKTGANVSNVAKAVGLDARLGPKFLQAGLGFGGSCFKKDILSLAYLAETLELPEVSQYWRSVIEINEWQCCRFVRSVVRKLNGSLRGKKVAVLGYAFKKDTADTRESQATEVVRMLCAECPSEIAIYDPQCDKTHVEAELAGLFSASTSSPALKPNGPVSVCDSPYEACAAATAVLILTEWDQFRYPSVSPLQPVRPKLHDFDSGYNSDSTMTGEVPTLQTFQANNPLVMSCDNTNPEPACPGECKDCMLEVHGGVGARDPIDWPTVARLMHGERYLFDGRGVVDPEKMEEEVGFRVETIGRARSR
ncbi:UDP-glucose/GDP-mannose dehydrogenase [Pseudocercospora fijiensis CIRAD86]|uniref:UDP-glucose 6-dehydrogenase n=1 Tax=Pseudocercospora fijiensis (strain CIRAD86) TaxID=383855 RepID=M3BDB0_PSEFD|nr:UDP-glucose/GDP-mannose dehydrogenase [Pseudocercospora fijiensis CIRAD86]EME87133.1 UDP-glucose/GDP-mannose dehydrogenase [Pseudocercospora fijiensis CIRAD86]